MKRKPIRVPLVRERRIATDGRVTGNNFFFSSISDCCFYAILCTAATTKRVYSALCSARGKR
ncbi:hypothetical protein DAPPUDRAFT_305233 [Daphnia pulex]|uniref:Uncharacterized protein n=1 Tax=Daphnia pulex TaxID=6669 RepID=E9GQK7_DAPPU|nr:hypothetical protein DAPPUDRAFT_305233 [Daphnia pulex]|eukprot:EFX78127.1 hypothetical protein DAPPUDRAFT_305233 [Daphnia pulex]